MSLNGEEAKGADAPEYYLVCFPAKPIRLKPGTLYSIGRSEENNIVLPDTEASRRHAVVRWDGNQFVVKDLDSRNGTFLNRQRIEESPLSDGDRIKIGLRTFKFMAAHKGPAEKLFEKKREEVSVELTVEDRLQTKHGLFGSLSDFKIPELIQALELNRKTGKLIVAGSKGRSEVFIKDGQIVAASLGEMTGEDAVCELLTFKEGFFDFEQSVVDVDVNVRKSTSFLLIEGLRRIDEMQKDSASSGGKTDTKKKRKRAKKTDRKSPKKEKPTKKDTGEIIPGPALDLLDDAIGSAFREDGET